MSIVGRALLASALVMCASAAAAQSQGGRPPSLPESLTGRDSFQFYCATCHGVEGRGDGPLASELRSRPADLTALARRNLGQFPRDQVVSFVTGRGRTLAAHGPTEMPICGPLFRAFETSEARVRQRIENLVTYIESLQMPSSGVDALGSQLFRTYCASCHGVTARGNGPLADALRRPPPDLTQFTRRNGGVFPSARVYDIIDGRGVPSHGDREMPIWGDAFRYTREGATAESIKERIEAIVAYLAAIQERAAE